ncbi:MAG: tetratricopeptide repeat protein [Candidatus Kapaibacterium sp.]
MSGLGMWDRRFKDLQRPLIAIVCLYVALMVSGQSACAQGSRAAVARSYEQSGDYRSAARLWQTLYEEDPKNEEVFLGVCRTLTALDNAQALRDIVGARLQKYRTFATLVIHGQLLWKSGNVAGAVDAWHEAVSKGTASDRVYMDVARAQLEVRAFDESIRTLERGRRALGRPDLFSEDLTKLYATVGDLTSGVREIVAVFDRSSQLPFAQGRISALLTSDSATQVVFSLISKEYRRRGDDDIAFARLYEWFLREIRRPAEAYDVVRNIDDRLGSSGRELVNFAEAMRAEGNYEVAMRAFSRVMGMGRKSDVAQYAAFGYAACTEARAAGSGTTLPTSEIIDLYRTIIRDYPRTSTAADAYLRVAALLEIQGAATSEIRQEYRTVREQYAGFPQAAQAALALARVCVAEDSMDMAHRYVHEAESMRGSTEDIIDEARFMGAEILFFQGFMDSASAVYAMLAERPESVFANDAIERMTTIRQCSEDSLLLDAFARAGRAKARRRVDDALTSYETVIRQNRNSDMAELACIKAAETCFAERRYGACREYCERLRGMASESIHADRALVLQARSFRAEGRKTEAKAAYEELLRSYPRSIFGQEARSTLRMRDMQ